jgi:hypothetical protein
MDKWSANSGCHEEDTWIYATPENGVKVRQREFDMYFSGRNNLDVKDDSKSWVIIRNIALEDAILLFSSCYNVEEWANCPELLNNFQKIDIDVTCLEEIRLGTQNTTMHDKLEEIMKGNDKWFVRSSFASPKDNISVDKNSGEQALSFTNAHSALYAVATSGRCSLGVESGLNRYIWVAPWRNLDGFNDYRVFIRDNVVRAISQYNMEDPPNDLEQVRKAVKDLWSRVKDELWYTECCMDVVYNSDTNEIKIVEFNEFGASCRAGSALYNWVQDMHLLYFGDADIPVNPGGYMNSFL